MSPALAYSLIGCAVSIVMEGIFAGGGIKLRLAELRVPRYAPPLWGWIVIGLLYYVMCFVVLYRLFARGPDTGRNVALMLIGSIMFINALWNYFFFRSRNLLHAFLIGLPYGLFAFVLFGVLLRLDRQAAWTLLPYLVYLFYAAWFSYRVWKLNAAEN